MKRRFRGPTPVMAGLGLVMALGCGGGEVIDGPMGPGLMCGNGNPDPDEECDDGNESNTDACTNECTVARCNDGFLQDGEVCDDGNEADDDACTSTCELGPKAIAAVVAGEVHTCALARAGTVHCWGVGSNGRLGQPTYDDNIGDDEPPSDWDPLDMGGEVVELAAGTDHTCARYATGAVRCWGVGNGGRLGYGNTDDVGFMQSVAEVGDIDLGGSAQSIAAGRGHTCAIVDGGAVRCFGENNSGQLGLGNTDRVGDMEPPSSVGPIDLPGPAVQVAAGDDHTCAVLQGGNVSCWGRAAEGQLGYGANQNVGDDELPSAAGPVPVGGPVTQIAAGRNHTCARLEAGTVRCWGVNTRGQLGTGDTDNVGDRKKPEEIGDIELPGPALAVAAGISHSCALMDDGQIRCWGDAEPSGIEGVFEELPTTAVRLGALAQTVAAGGEHTCALTGSATVRCWGSNAGGLLGYPDVGSNSVVRDPSEHGDVDIVP